MYWGHGFMPRIHSGNAGPVDRCLEPPKLDGSLLELPWTLVEATWASRRPPLLDHLRSYGTQLLVDTQSWRYREESTFGVQKFAKASYAPRAPFPELSEKEFENYVRRDLDAQANLGAGAYLVPGYVPRGRGDDSADLTLAAVDTALKTVGGDIKPMPLIGFIGVHTRDFDAAYRLLEKLPYSLEAVYVQFTPVTPTTDAPGKLVAIAEFLLACQERGLDVIGGRLGAIGQLLRGVGVSAVDAGLGAGETFNFANAVRPSTKPGGGPNRGPVGPRMYVNQIARSVNGRDWSRFASLPSIKGLMVCSLHCCRFRRFDEILKRAGEHSLHGRIKEARDLHALPPTVRAESVWNELLRTRSTIASINSALVEAGEVPISDKHVGNYIATMARLLRKPEAA